MAKYVNEEEVMAKFAEYLKTLPYWISHGVAKDELQDAIDSVEDYICPGRYASRNLN